MAFEHFFRFFRLSDSGKTIPVNRLTTFEQHPVMPVVAGDTLLFLVPRSDVPSDLSRLRIDLINTATNAVFQAVGQFRAQDGNLCSQIRLRINKAPKTGENKQFALIGEVNGEERTILGTFKGAQTDLDSYIQAIREHFEAYPFAPVTVDQYGNELLVRIYHTDHFQLGNQPLRIGLGKNRVYNTNGPQLTAVKGLTVTKPAKDRFSVLIGDDFEVGNRFSLRGTIYTVKAGDTKQDILNGLGVSSGGIEVDPETTLSYSAEVGTQTVYNRNQPTLKLTFDSVSGGNDLYTISVGVDIQAGNIYQIAVSGQATKTLIAEGDDTAATIAAFFATSGGKLSVTSGSVPVVSTIPGTQEIANSNNPEILLTDKVSFEEHDIDEYSVYVGTSIRRGNIFVLGDQSVTATDADNPLTIAEKLGYAGRPFKVEVPEGETLIAYARKGKALSQDNIADVKLVEGSVWMQNLPFVCRVDVPDLPEGVYQLRLFNTVTEQVEAVSNYINVLPDEHETAIIRYGDNFKGSGRNVFGYEYGEIGLMQQVRVPIWISEAKQFVAESVNTTFTGETRIQSAQITNQRTLITSSQPASFHRALLAALKHPVLYINGVAYQAFGEYSEEFLPGRDQLIQAECTLNETNSLRSLYDFYAYNDYSLSARYGLIEDISGVNGLSFFLQSENITKQVRKGDRVEPGTYKLLVRATYEPIRLAVYQNGLLVDQVALTPRFLNRVVTLYIKANDRIQIVAHPDKPIAVSDYRVELANNGFNEGFNDDFN